MPPYAEADPSTGSHPTTSAGSSSGSGRPTEQVEESSAAAAHQFVSTYMKERPEVNQLTSTDEWISHMASVVGQFLWVGGARSRRASVVSLVSPSHATARAAVALPLPQQLHSRRALQSELSSCQADTWQGTCAVPAPPPSPPALPLLTCGPGTVYNASSNLCEITCDYSGRRLGEENADSYLICLCLPGSRTLWRKAPIVTVVA